MHSLFIIIHKPFPKRLKYVFFIAFFITITKFSIYGSVSGTVLMKDLKEDQAAYVFATSWDVFHLKPRKVGLHDPKYL